MQIFDYNHDYDPPAPFVKVVLHNRKGKSTEPLETFVDSGADATIVPRTILKSIKATVSRQGTIRSQWGEPRLISLYLVDIQIGDIAIVAVEVVGDPTSQELILGRDALNQMRVVLNGLGEAVEVHSH